MDRLNKCKLCKNQELRVLNGYEDAGELVRCSRCGMVFANLIPSESILAEHYGGYGMFAGLSETTIKRYNELLDKFEKFRVTNKILDVGCGEGFFLEQAKKRGWEVHGTEYAPQYVEACKRKDINMHTGVLDLENYQLGSFDVIVSIEVIEHLLYPVQELEKFFKLLRSDGLAFLTTPNFNSFSRRMQGKNWSVISYPDHLNYFTPRTLDQAMRITGFNNGKINTAGISISRLQQALFRKKTIPVSENSSKDACKHEPLDTKWQSRIEHNAVLRITKTGINKILNLTGSGDGMKAFYQK